MRHVRQTHNDRECLFTSYEVGEELRSIWCESVLELPQTRAELKRIAEEDVLDMDFDEEEVVKDMERWHGNDVYYKANEESLDDDRWTLKRFGEVLLADCIDQVHRDEHVPLFFEFSIPR